MSNLSEAVEHTLQKLQIEARATLAQEASPKSSKRLTPVEAQYQRCCQALRALYGGHRTGPAGLHPARDCGKGWSLGAETVARWLHAPGFPERRIRSDRRRDPARFLQDLEGGLQPALARTHFS
jgi:hypothetical protein